MNYRVKVKSLNKIFIVNNKPVRSPFECYINDNNLLLIKARIKFYGINEKEYEIESINQDLNQKKDIKQEKREPDRNIIKQERNKTNINQKQTEDTNKIEIKQKILNKEEKLVHKPQIVEKETSNTTVKENTKDFENNLEQIINLKSDDKDSDDTNSDMEVKIEELTIKSSSILEKFLQSEF